MKTDYLEKRRRIFQEALDIEPARRSRFVSEQCNGDSKLLEDVRTLLAAVDDDEDFLGRSAPEEAAVAATLRTQAGLKAGSSLHEPLGPGARIGSYRILRVLGTGGMGVVYAAEQDSPRREVALKVILPGLIAPTLLRRFTHEAQALGMLQHPGIARVYEAGTDGMGPALRPYLAMELVNGRPLSDYTGSGRDGASASLPEKLELFARICDAVHHAHQRGVIHRDLKPGNILVETGAGHESTHPHRRVGSQSDSAPTGDAGLIPKILDFGVARILSSDARHTTLHTAAGAIIGTPAYMSPEQIAGDPDAADVRSDVYSLGVIFFELLTGRLPHDVVAKPLAEAARIIRDEEPTRLTAISKLYRGDLDTIVAKAIAKAKARRYDSAAELAADVRRCLTGEPIMARRDSVVYVMRKALRRHRLAAGIAAVFLVMMVVFTVYSAIAAQAYRRLAGREATARASAVSNAKRADDELRASVLERARLLGTSADRSSGEALLWLEHFKDPSREDTLLALREFYLRNPCSGTVSTRAKVLWNLAVNQRRNILLCSGVDQPSVEIWDGATQSRLGEVRAGANETTHAVFSPDGELVYTLGDSRCLSLSTVPTPAMPSRVISTLDLGTEGATTLAVDPCGRFLLVGSQLGRLTVHDAASLAPLLDLSTSGPPFHCLVFDKTGHRLLAAHEDGLLEEWSFPSLLLVRSRRPTGQGLNWVDFSDDGNLIATGGARVAHLLDGHSFEVVGSIPVPTGTVRSVGLIHGGLTLATASWWSLDFWDVSDPSDPTHIRSIAAGPGAFIRLASISSQNAIVTSYTGILRFWELDDHPGREVLRPPDGRSPRSAAFAIAPDRASAAIITRDGVNMLDLRTRDWERRFLGLSRGRNRAAINASGEWLAVTDPTRSAGYFWDLRSGGPPVAMVVGEGGFAHQARISPDGGLAAVCDSNGRVRVWGTSDWSLKASLNLTPGHTSGMEFSPDGKRLVIGRFRSIEILDASTLKPLRSVDTSSYGPYSLAVSRDGTLIATGEWNRTIGLWRESDLARVGELAGHNGLPWWVRFNDSGTRLVSAGDDYKIKVWDLASRRSLLTLEEPLDAPLRGADFALDDQLIVAHTAVGVEIWSPAAADRHIAGNLEYQFRRSWPELSPEQRVVAKTWARRILGREPSVEAAGTPAPAMPDMNN